MRKILCFTMAAAIAISSTPLAHAANTNNYEQGTQVIFIAENNEGYTITVPAKLNPGQSGPVTLSGSWPSNKTISVTAEKTVTLTNSILSSDQKVLDVTFLGISEAGDDTSAQTYTERVSVEAIEGALFGTWNGKFNYNVDSVVAEAPPTGDYLGVVSSDNTITLSGVETAGTYTLRYANANGPLADCKEICTLEVADPAVDVVYDDLIAENCAPIDATMIAVYDANNEKVGEIALGGLKANLGAKLYNFGAISDVHMGYETSEADLSKALTYFSNETNASFVGIAGDLTAEASDAEYQLYKDTVSQNASIPVYAITGNHDTATYRGSNVSSIIANYTGKPSYYSFEHGDDVFIMLGVEKEERGSMMAEGEMQWFFETLEANRNKRCFVFTHAYPNNSSGDPSDLYGFDMWAYDEETMLNELLSHYPNVTMFHGHSHIEFAIQSVADEANVHTSAGYNSIHIPSITAPRTGELGGDSVMFDYLLDESEGYLVDVYENGIILRGRDFVRDKFLPIASYQITTPISSVEAGTYTDSTGKLDITTTYDSTVTTNLTNAYSSYPYNKVMSGTSFETVIATDWGYAIEDIVVTMNGEDISESAVSNNKISITEVTGNIVITVSTQYVSDNIIDIVGYQNDTRFSASSGVEKEEPGHVASGLIYVGDVAVGESIVTSGVDYRDVEWPNQGIWVGFDKDMNIVDYGYFDSTEIWQFSVSLDENGNLTLLCTAAEDELSYIRISGVGLGENLTVTKN
jgi:predicted MPP superfamily phosphohydrolase